MSTLSNSICFPITDSTAIIYSNVLRNGKKPCNVLNKINNFFSDISFFYKLTTTKSRSNNNPLKIF